MTAKARTNASPHQIAGVSWTYTLYEKRQSEKSKQLKPNQN